MARETSSSCFHGRDGEGSNYTVNTELKFCWRRRGRSAISLHTYDLEAPCTLEQVRPTSNDASPSLKRVPFSWKRKGDSDGRPSMDGC